MELLPGKTLQQLLKDFNQESNRVRALNYNVFLNADMFNGNSIMDALYYLQKFVNWPTIKNINKAMTIDTNKNLVIEFYETLGLRDHVESILKGDHPMFETRIDDTSSSYVGNKAYYPRLIFSVGEARRAQGAINLAHESAHAISGYYAEMQELKKEETRILETYGKDSREFEEFKPLVTGFLDSQREYMVDCTSEIASRIMELLLLDFLIEKNTITQEDKQLYLDQRDAAFRSDLALMFQEDIIYSKIIEIKKEKDCHIAELNEEEYEELMKRLSKNSHHKQLVKKFHFISDRRKLDKTKWNSQYVFRYVISEIVSRVWYDRYLSASAQEKIQMIDDLKTYIANSHQFTLKGVVELLLKESFVKNIINEFADLHMAENKENRA